jgi:catechol 2,3-dioxygenase-like lactoylglutathione lyase family enzyme
VAVELVALAMHSNTPEAIARFWGRALGWEAEQVASGDVELTPTDPTRFRLVVRAGAAAKVGRNPIHFDLTSTSAADQQSLVADLVAHGAQPADVGQVGDEGHVVLADPDGNEFCVIEPGNRFLASCPRLGAVNCDGTKELGYFFSTLLEWPLVWDQDEETAIQSPTGDGPKITWSGPPLMAKSSRERIHFHVAPAAGTPLQHAVAEMLRLGATHAAEDGRGCPGAVALADVDGNTVCLVATTSS